LAAHQEFEDAMAVALSRIPPEAERWQRFNDYYVNCLKEVDRKVDALIRELDDLGSLDDTIIIFTSDHGEMGGAHGMRGKGGNGYEESIHVPLSVVTPDGPAGVSCDAVTPHVDGWIRCRSCVRRRRSCFGRCDPPAPSQALLVCGAHL
jgi:arylsulfatase